jgi:hypothetical protein
MPHGPPTVDEAHAGDGPSGPPGRVDHEVGLQTPAVDHGAGDPPSGAAQAVHVALADRQARYAAGGCPERPLEGLPARAVSSRHLPDTGDVESDRLRTERQPRVERGRPYVLEDLGHLRTKAVRVVELHHPAAGPVPVPRRSGVALDGDDVVTAVGEGAPHEQAGRTGSDDHDPHGAARLLQTESASHTTRPSNATKPRSTAGTQDTLPTNAPKGSSCSSGLKSTGTTTP